MQTQTAAISSSHSPPGVESPALEGLSFAAVKPPMESGHHTHEAAESDPAALPVVEQTHFEPASVYESPPGEVVAPCQSTYGPVESPDATISRPGSSHVAEMAASPQPTSTIPPLPSLYHPTTHLLPGSQSRSFSASCTLVFPPMTLGRFWTLLAELELLRKAKEQWHSS